MWDLMGIEKQVGIELSSSLAMLPASAVSALVFAHKQSKYFSVNELKKDQVENYAARKVCCPFPNQCRFSLPLLPKTSKFALRFSLIRSHYLLLCPMFQQKMKIEEAERWLAPNLGYERDVAD